MPLSPSQIVSKSLFFIVDETMAGPTGWQLVERKGDGGCLSASRCSCAIPTRVRPKRWKNSLRFWFSSPLHSIQLAFLVPDRAATKGRRDGHRTESDNKKFTHPLSLARSPSRSRSVSLICPNSRLVACYLNSSRTDRLNARRGGGRRAGVTEGCSLEFRSDNEHRRGERSMRDSPLL